MVFILYFKIFFIFYFTLFCTVWFLFTIHYIQANLYFSKSQNLEQNNFQCSLHKMMLEFYIPLFPLPLYWFHVQRWPHPALGQHPGTMVTPTAVSWSETWTLGMLVPLPQWASIFGFSKEGVTIQPRVLTSACYNYTPFHDWGSCEVGCGECRHEPALQCILLVVGVLQTLEPTMLS